MMANYTEVTQEVLSLAEELIGEFHPLLKECKIGFVFRDEAGQSGGKTVLARTSTVPQNVRPHLQDELDILIVIAEDMWSGLGYSQRRALIDHELCHIVFGGSGWTTRAHEIEEFGEILQRYGLWNQDLFRTQVPMAHAVQLLLSIESVEKTERGAVIAVDAKKFAHVGEMSEV